MLDSGTVRVAHGGFEWEVLAASAKAIGTLLEAFPAVTAMPGGRVLKSNHFRTVCALPDLRPPGAPGGVLAKVYRYTSLWDRLRYLAIAHRALQEWEALRRLRSLGLPVPQAHAYARCRQGGLLRGGGLVVSFLEGTAPLAERLHALCVDRFELSSQAVSLIEATGALVRSLHDRGAHHRDLHAGNILVEGEAGPLHLIDLHTCVFRRRLSFATRRSGLAKLLHSLRLTLPPAGMRRLIEAYGPEALAPRSSLAGVEERLGAQVARLQRIRVRSRSRRCFLPSTQFAVERRAGERVYHLRRLGADTLAPLWQATPPGELLKPRERGWVCAVQLGDERVCVKHRRYTLREGLQALLESHDLRRAYAAGHSLAVRGLPSPAVIALRERRRFGLVREAHLVTSLLGGAQPLGEHLLAEYWRRPASGERARRKRLLATAVGSLVRSLHAEGLFAHDLAPHNVLVLVDELGRASRGEAASFLSLVDLDHLYLWKPLSRRGRLKNLADIGNLPEGHVGTTDLTRGLRAYLGGDLSSVERDWLLALRERLLAAHWKSLLRLTAGPAAPLGAP